MMIQHIEVSIQSGLQKSYYSLMKSSDEGSFRSKVTEYLNTTFIFMELVNLQRPLKYAIYLEYSAKFFYENAFNIFPFGPGAAKNEYERNPPPPPIDFKKPENGRIDIVITKKLASRKIKKRNRFVERSMIGIEVKGINPRSDLLLKDYDRLAICLLAEWRQNDKNSISFCFLGYIKKIGGGKKPITSKKVETELNSIKVKQESIFKRSKYFSLVDTYIEVFDMYSYNEDDYKNNIPEEYWEEGDAAFETGAAFGITIRLRRKEI